MNEENYDAVYYDSVVASARARYIGALSEAMATGGQIELLHKTLGAEYLACFNARMEQEKTQVYAASSLTA